MANSVQTLRIIKKIGPERKISQDEGHRLAKIPEIA
jgi:hypothetical protein